MLKFASAACDDAVALHDSSLCSRNSGGTGGLLPVQRSTSYCLDNSLSDTGRFQGPTGRTVHQRWGFQSGRRFASCLRGEASVNFRPAGGVRGQVAVSLPRRHPGTGTRRVRESAVTLSLHPEVPGIQFVSPGRGLGIRQSMGWTKVCGTARSGIWVPKGNARTCMFPANLDHLRVEWMKRVLTRLPGLRQGTTVCVHTNMDVEQQSDRKLITPSGIGLLVCGAGSHPSYHLVVVRRMCQRE